MKRASRCAGKIARCTLTADAPGLPSIPRENLGRAVASTARLLPCYTPCLSREAPALVACNFPRGHASHGPEEDIRLKVYPGSAIRNIAITGHSNSGKTSLVNSLLATAGAAEFGTSPTVYDEEEIARDMTLANSVAWCEWNTAKINLLDTPGFTCSSTRRSARWCRSSPHL